MLLKKITAAFCAAVMLGSAVCTGVPTTAADTEMRDITTMELVREMGVGINLGNTMESCGDWIDQWGDGTPNAYETAWGSPTITKAMIQGYANEGFGVLRIPVAWSNMMQDNYTIHPDYLARVKQLVDWALEADLYVIVNIHWDGGWWENFPTDKETCMTKYTRIWEQLCDAFASYGDKLMFESLNEEGGWSNISTSDSYYLLNDINQTFVDLVRTSGGNNDERHLLIAGYNTDITKTCDALFEMPEDPENRCAVSVHYYTPPTFAILEEDADWGKCRTTWGTDADLAELDKYMDMMKSRFIDNGVPVIIGEYGCPTKNKDADSVRLYIASVAEAAYERQMCPVLWDTTGLHYSRSSCTMNDQTLRAQLEALTAPAGNAGIGDVTLDGTVNALDAAKVLVAAANVGSGAASGLNADQTANADVNGDGLFNASDAARILQYAAAAGSGYTGTAEEFFRNAAA